jgi:hypothetical protein
MSHTSGARSPWLARRGFWSRGELRKPHQCSIAFLEPCWSRGIRSNEKRALAANALYKTIPVATAESHMLFNPVQPEPLLECDFVAGATPSGRSQKTRGVI